MVVGFSLAVPVISAVLLPNDACNGSVVACNGEDVVNTLVVSLNVSVDDSVNECVGAFVGGSVNNSGGVVDDSVGDDVV